MINNSMIDKLSKQANVSYADAKEALEMTDWEILDAYVWLEAQGKIDSLDAQQTPAAEEKSTAPQGKQAKKIRGFFASLLHLLQNNFFCIRMKDGYTRRVPLLAALLIALLFRKLVFFSFLIALCCGVKFYFEGPDMAGNQNSNA